MKQTHYSSFADMYLDNPSYKVFSPKCWRSGDLPVSFTRVKQGDVDTIDPATQTFALGLSLSGRAAFEVDFGEGLRKISTFSQGVYLNATLGDTHYRQRGSYDLLILDSPLDNIAAALDLDRDKLNEVLRPLHDAPTFDASARALCLDLWAQSRKQGTFDSLAIDHGLLALVAKLASLARPESRNSFAKTQLSREGFMRVCEYLDEHLDIQITTADLARLVGLKSWQFIRDFKVITGKAPHQYLLEYRVQRAQQLLAATTMPLVEVACACGFSSQSHMTGVFRQKLGITPGSYRRETHR